MHFDRFNQINNNPMHSLKSVSAYKCRNFGARVFFLFLKCPIYFLLVFLFLHCIPRRNVVRVFLSNICVSGLSAHRHRHRSTGIFDCNAITFISTNRTIHAYVFLCIYYLYEAIFIISDREKKIVYYEIALNNLKAINV